MNSKKKKTALFSNSSTLRNKVFSFQFSVFQFSVFSFQFFSFFFFCF